MKKRFTFLLVPALVLTLGAYAQNRFVGTVFDDANGNSQLDAGEKGVAGVGVSNGSDVVRTDAAGRYELPVSDRTVLFVIQPAGYRVPFDERQLPQFHYVHKPAGSPAQRYPGSAPTGALPDAVNFPLLRSDDPENFNILVFGDSQPYNEKEIDYLRRTVANLPGIGEMTFGVTLGDVTGDRPDLFEPVSSVIAQIGLPWHHLPGNHDHNLDATSDEVATETWEAFFGPTTYSFNRGKVHFIVADDILHTPNAEARSRYVGGLREDQFRFIENDLKLVPKDHLIVLMAHIPLFDEGGETFRHTDRDRLFALLSPFEHTLSLSAHTHYIKPYFFDRTEGWPGAGEHFHLNAGAICGDWWKGVVDQYDLPGSMMRDGAPQGYFVLKFTGNEYVYDYHTVHDRDPQQISLYLQDNTLYANFFIGNKLSTLRYRVDGGAWQPMTMSFEHDPLFTAIRGRWDNQEGLPGKTPSQPTVSEHLWKAPIALSRKNSVVEVEAVDGFGRTFTRRMIVE